MRLKMLWKVCYDNRRSGREVRRVVRRHFTFYGAVQGVGFRYYARHAAQAVGATGWVRNEYDGSVTMELQGTPDEIDRVLEMVQRGRFVHIERMEARDIPLDEDERSFHTDR